jgi:hypothetical protein
MSDQDPIKVTDSIVFRAPYNLLPKLPAMTIMLPDGQSIVCFSMFDIVDFGIDRYRMTIMPLPTAAFCHGFHVVMKTPDGEKTQQYLLTPYCGGAQDSVARLPILCDLAYPLRVRRYMTSITFSKLVTNYCDTYIQATEISATLEIMK